MSGTIGSPNLRAHTLIQRNVGDIKQRLEVARSEAVTGRAHDVGRAVNGDTGKLAQLSDAISYAQDRENVLRFEGERMAMAQQTIGVMRDQATDVLVTLRARGDTLAHQASNAEVSAFAGLSDTVSRLNGSFGSRPLFGGETGTAPMGQASDILDALRGIAAAAPDTDTALTQIDAWFNDPTGGFQTGIYTGGDDAPKVEVSKGERIATSVRADDPAFRDLLQGMAVTALAAEADTDAQRQTLLKRGETILARASEGAIALQGRLGVGEERAANALADHTAQAATLSIAYNGLTGRDQAEAVTEMRLLESQLEAAYLTTSRMANLTLLNFLR